MPTYIMEPNNKSLKQVEFKVKKTMFWPSPNLYLYFSTLIVAEDQDIDFQFNDYDKALGARFEFRMVYPFWTKKTRNVCDSNL